MFSPNTASLDGEDDAAVAGVSKSVLINVLLARSDEKNNEDASQDNGTETAALLARYRRTEENYLPETMLRYSRDNSDTNLTDSQNTSTASHAWHREETTVI